MPHRLSRAGGWGGGIVAAFVAVSVACGLVWRSRLHVPSGVVAGGRWFPDPWDQGEQSSFAAIGWYVVIALAAGIVLGLLAAWLSRAPELVTLAAVVVGSLLAAWLMRTVGLHGAPPDPGSAAAHAADGTRMSGTIARPGAAAFITWPLAALVTLAVVFLLRSDRPARSASFEG
jgi:ribose/xylose/arabinose/galactoside ABC-type transport system permease subunit